MTRTIDRRQMLKRTGLAIAAAGAVAQLAPTAQAQEKLPQAAIMYQNSPKDGHQCSACQHWQPPNACAIVQGPIAPTGWCGAFAPKE